MAVVKNVLIKKFFAGILIVDLSAFFNTKLGHQKVSWHSNSEMRQAMTHKKE